MIRKCTYVIDKTIKENEFYATNNLNDYERLNKMYSIRGLMIKDYKDTSNLGKFYRTNLINIEKRYLNLLDDL